jgi:uncharacterized protein (TIGR02246 family)
MNDGVTGLYTELIQSWNKQDGRAMASTFADDGEMIGFDGSQIVGRSEIAKELEGIFADHETASFVAKVKAVRTLAPDIALLSAAAGMVQPGESDLNPDVNTHHRLLAQETDGEWKIVLFQNTPAQFHGRPELKEQMTEELRREM